MRQGRIERGREGCREKGRDGEGRREIKREGDRMTKNANQFSSLRHQIHKQYNFMLLLIFTGPHIVEYRSQV